MTVDEKVVAAGRSQRRPGPHVDGVFMPDKFHPIRNAMGSWGGGGRWNHYCNDIGVGPVRRTRRRGGPAPTGPAVILSRICNCGLRWLHDGCNQPRAQF
jgi:hypothetical protein